MKKLLIPLITSAVLLFPFGAKAQLELAFAGVASFSIPCTCSGTLAIWFAPLYLGGPILITGPVTYSPYSTLPFADFMIGVPTAWHLGSFLPGVQACWIYVGVSCVPFPTIGLMTKVGTNRALP